ncbi:hypothetical protein DFJ63DRAFT_313659 [Scheffersomyces coipomensis]|uniref:uncharacterized protein n=1 Tax=Scheffersomyces coipomensis TaxID=1788519 RepID=UPI00315D86F4
MEKKILTMNDYISDDLIKSSVNLIIDNTKDGAQYNAYVDYDNCEELWKQTLESFEKHDDFKLDRLKLCFSLCRFALVTRLRPSRLELSNDYLSSKDYIVDHGECCYLIETKTLEYLETLVTPNKSLVKKLFGLNSSFSIAFPKPSVSKNVYSKSSFISRNPVILDHYNLITPYCQDPQKMFSISEYENLNLDTNLISAKNGIFSPIPLNNVSNEDNVSKLASHCFLHMKMLLEMKFGYVEVKDQDNESSRSIPCHSFNITKQGHTFKLPVEVKIRGLREAVQSESLEFLIQSFYQMITSKASWGILIDTEIIIIIKIKPSNFNKNRDCNVTKQDEYKVDLQIESHYHNSFQSFTAIMQIILNDYFTKVDHEVVQLMERLRSKLEKSENQIQEEDTERFKILEKFWSDVRDSFSWNDEKNAFVHSATYLSECFSKNDQTNSYIHNATNLSIPEKYYSYLSLMSPQYDNLVETDFRIVRNVQGGTKVDRTKYHSQVALVHHIDSDTDAILKVYNPIYSPRSAVGSKRSTFIESASFGISMFINEVMAYTTLRESEPNGIDDGKPESAGTKGTEGHVNYVPHVFSYGFSTWENPLTGFFILQEYIIEDEKLKPEALKLAQTALQYIHSKGVLHNDIKPSNMIFSKGRCYFIDFGFSKMKHFSKIKKESYDTEKKKLVVEIKKIK